MQILDVKHHAGNTATMSSREIASLVGSRSASVNLSIARLLARGVITVENAVFSSQVSSKGSMTLGRAAKAYGIHRSSLYEAVSRGRVSVLINSSGRKEVSLSEMDHVYGNPDTPAPMEANVGGGSVYEYLLNKRNSFVVVAQLCPEFTARLVDRWQELESQLAQPITLPSYADTLRLYADQIEQTQRVTVERDNAIATKALIGSKREATAMATASQAVKKANSLERELDRAKDYCTVKRMSMVHHGQPFDWRTLKSASNEMGIESIDVFDQNYGTVKAYHSSVWLEVYGLSVWGEC